MCIEMNAVFVVADCAAFYIIYMEIIIIKKCKRGIEKLLIGLFTITCEYVWES